MHWILHFTNNIEQWLTGVSVLLLMITLIFTRVSAAILFTSAIMVCVLVGSIDLDEALSKATNESLVTLLLLILVSVGLERLPWLISASIRAQKRSLRKSLLSLSTMTMLCSAFVSNTAVVATLAGTLRKAPKQVASKLLLPISYSAILGGTLTLIGTSTNLIVSSFLEDLTGQGLDFFAFLPVALPAASACLVVILLTCHFLPSRSDEELPVADFLIEMIVSEDSRLIGNTIFDNGLRDLGDLFLVEIVRKGRLMTSVTPQHRIEAGDRLIFSGDVSRVGVLERFHGLRSFALDQGLLGANLTEVILLPSAAILGKSIKQAQFRSRFDAAVVGLRRDGDRLSGKLGNISLRAGDSLMLAVGPDFQKRSNISRNFLVTDRDISSYSLSFFKSFSVGVGILLTIFSAVMGWVPLVVGLLLLLICMLMMGLVSSSDLRRRFPFEMWLIVSSALALSQAVIDSGLMASGLGLIAPMLAEVSPLIVLCVVYVLTLLMTELITNNAAAALMFPFAYSLALASGSDAMPFVMAVALGGSASFLTPHGYTTNLMVQNLGGYTRADYFRFGWPVSLTYSVVVLWLLPRIFPF